jgi:hypothetical protein
MFSDLLPTVHANDVGIKSFYIHVKTAYGKNLDDNVWISFVWDIQIYSTIVMHNQNETWQGNQNTGNLETSNRSYIYDNNIHHDSIPMFPLESSYIKRSSIIR